MGCKMYTLYIAPYICVYVSFHLRTETVYVCVCVEHFNLNYINKYGGSRPLVNSE